MSHIENAVTSSSKAKRPYRKGSPLSPIERQQALIARRKETHKEIRVYVQNGLKNDLQRLCKAEGVTQSEMIETLIKTASERLDERVKD
ncbi:replication regulatory protein RepA [Rahnella sp. ChDrAdgB13]|uniref:replication regulatory protein RepA n=1 Tax=Rahnella sp. ChDrAdgB13 TaxID=1850581 RepID=UPI001AD889F9|nr:replication regulatory protein RepA [Rahnella sp. ChDrAdgB13]